MNNLHSIIGQWKSLRPADTRYPAASESSLQQFEAEFGPVPLEYRQFLLFGGGGVIGSEWLDGIEQLSASHARFAKERGPNGWKSSMFLIGWDGSGAPIGINHAGAVVVEYDGGEVVNLAVSFEAFLSESLRAER
jgi:hypothetical protein